MNNQQKTGLDFSLFLWLNYTGALPKNSLCDLGGILYLERLIKRYCPTSNPTRKKKSPPNDGGFVYEPNRGKALLLYSLLLYNIPLLGGRKSG